MSTSKRIIVRCSLFLVVTLILYLSFSTNYFKIVDHAWFKGFQKDSEGLVVSKIVASRSFSLLNNGGMLNLIDDPYNAYEKGIILDTTPPTYTSQVGIQGVVFSLLDKVTRIGNLSNIVIFRHINALILSIIFTIIIYLVYKEFNLWVSFCLFISFLMSSWLTVFATNLYWMSWTWFLPFVIVFSFLSSEERNGVYKSKRIYCFLFASVFIRVLIEFEYISTILVAMITPYFYYGIKNRWGIKKFIIRALGASVCSLSAFLLAFLIHVIQLTFMPEVSSISSAIHTIYNNAMMRTYSADPSIITSKIKDVKVSQLIYESLTASPYTVIKLYLSGNAFNLTGLFKQLPSSNIFYITFEEIIYLLLIFSPIPFLPEKTSSLINKYRQLLMALLCTTWISILAPLSWFVLAKSHSFIHTHLNFVLWYVPFVPFTIIYISFIIYCLGRDCIRDHKNKIYPRVLCLTLFSLLTISLLVNDFQHSKQIDSQIDQIVFGGSTLIEENGIKLFFYQNKLYYLIGSQKISRQKNPYIFVHVFPKNISDLSQSRIQHGFDNFDFLLDNEEIKTGLFSKYRKQKIAVRELSKYEINTIRTGQYDPNTSTVFWEVKSNLKY